MNLLQIWMDHIIILLDDHTRQIHFSFLFFWAYFSCFFFSVPSRNVRKFCIAANGFSDRLCEPAFVGKHFGYILYGLSFCRVVFFMAHFKLYWWCECVCECVCRRAIHIFSFRMNYIERAERNKDLMSFLLAHNFRRLRSFLWTHEKTKQN